MNETIAGDATGPARLPDAPDLPIVAQSPGAIAGPVEHAFEFHGAAREYFRIWIVNLALTILTVGIWSAWAKVRTERYFYANTRVAGTPFEYLANPFPILKGRVIAFTLLGSYILASRFSLKLQLALLLLIGLLSPWLIVRGLMFRARYSAWRGLTFRFVPDFKAAIRYYLLIYLLLPLTLGFIFPYIKWRQKQFVVVHHRFGRRDFDFDATAGNFYVPYAVALGMVFGTWIVVAMLFSALFPLAAAHASQMTMFYVVTGVSYLGYFLIFCYLAARVLNLTYNHAALAGFSLRSSLRARDLIRLYGLNTLAILLSLGMLIPWAMIRMARYRASRLVLLASDDLDTLEAEPQGAVSAVGAEIDSVFDLDIGL
jgi:uncharacterized membrane protein YjgN (DUF898 family)